MQDYLGRYQDLRVEWKRRREKNESTYVSDDILKEKYGIDGYRTTITADIEALIDFGMEIEAVKSSAIQYHLISREFDIPEIKLLIDDLRALQQNQDRERLYDKV